jgi:hypothetical protein
VSTAASGVRDDQSVAWQAAEGTSPHRDEPVPVVVARDVVLIHCEVTRTVAVSPSRAGYHTTNNHTRGHRPLCSAIRAP